jgi:hypothetical protein
MADVVVFTRSEWLDRLSGNFKARVIDAGLSSAPDIGPDSYENKLFSSVADSLAIMSQDARIIGRGVSLQDMNFDQLKEFGALPGINIPPLDAVGAFGYMIASTAPGGTNLHIGDEWVDNSTKLIYRVVQEFFVTDGQWFPVQCKTGGVATNVAAGTVLTASVVRAGCYPTAVVATQTDGTGLSDGRDAETEGDYRNRLSNAIAHPAAMGNVDQIIAAAENSKGHGVPVAKAFVYPAIIGPGTFAVAVVLTPLDLVSNRNPSAGQLSAIGSFIQAQMGMDDGIFMLENVNQNVLPIFTVSWAKKSSGWADFSVWPLWNNQLAYISGAGDATHFEISATNYTGFGSPSVGTNLGFFNPTTGLFVRKRVLSFTGTGSWSITVNTEAGASDLSYAPVVNQMVMPWSDNLNDLAPTILKYFASIGPGENVTDAFAPTSTDRCRRHPEPDPDNWPTTLTGKVASLLGGIASVADSKYITDVAVGLSHSETTTTVGTVTVNVKLLHLQDVCILPTP